MYVGTDTAVVVDAAASAPFVGTGAGVFDVVSAGALVDAAEVVPLADTGKQHASNVTAAYQHALSPRALRPVSQHE